MRAAGGTVALAAMVLLRRQVRPRLATVARWGLQRGEESRPDGIEQVLPVRAAAGVAVAALATALRTRPAGQQGSDPGCGTGTASVLTARHGADLGVRGVPDAGERTESDDGAA